MTGEVFNELVERRIEDIKHTLTRKGREYARGDRLSNFKKAARLENTIPEKALRGMLSKHLISVYDMIDDLNNSIESPMETWKEKIGDSINYLILLEALLYERKEATNLQTL
jgi:hypothetical protein